MIPAYIGAGALTYRSSGMYRHLYLARLAFIIFNQDVFM
jgi:hypothetical protein